MGWFENRRAAQAFLENHLMTSSYHRMSQEAAQKVATEDAEYEVWVDDPSDTADAPGIVSSSSGRVGPSASAVAAPASGGAKIPPPRSLVPAPLAPPKPKTQSRPLSPRRSGAARGSKKSKSRSRSRSKSKHEDKSTSAARVRRRSSRSRSKRSKRSESPPGRRKQRLPRTAELQSMITSIK